MCIAGQFFRLVMRWFSVRRLEPSEGIEDLISSSFIMAGESTEKEKRKKQLDPPKSLLGKV